MEVFLFVALIVIAVLFYLFTRKDQTKLPPPPSQVSETSPPQPPSQNIVARDALTRINDSCQSAAGDAYNSLIIAAVSDGKVSRDELRVAMWFCEGCGARFEEEDLQYVSKLNAGVKMTCSSSQSAADLAKDCVELSVPQLLRLYAAHTTIGKPWNKTARRSREVLDVIQNMIVTKLEAPPTTPE